MSSRAGVPIALVLAAIVCAGEVLARAPQHGLYLARFADPALQSPIGFPVVDRTIYFHSDDGLHPVPPWVHDHTSSRWNGYVEAPRDGEYLFKLTSDDAGSLTLDGKQVINLPGDHSALSGTASLTWKKGYHAITIEHGQATGGTAMLLEWRLPSGYHTMGLLPVSMLSPEIPPPVTAGDHALRLLTSVLLLAAVAWTQRERLTAALDRLRSDAIVRGAFMAGLLVLGLALGARLYDLNGAGETADEWAYLAAGRVYAENIAIGDIDADQWRVNREHPAIGKLIYGWVYYNFGDSDTATRAASAVMSTTTILLVFLIALRLFGVEAAVLAGLILSLLPPFLAHGKIAALDCPATLLHASVVWLLFRGLHDTRLRARSFTLMSIMLGLAVATKITNGLLLPYVLCAFVLTQWAAVRRTGQLSIHWSVFMLPAIVVIPFGATWPWLWQNTIAHLTETFGHWTYVPGDLFFGVDAHEAPRIYFFACFAAETPVLLAAVFLKGMADAFRKRPPRILRSDHTDSTVTDRAWWWLLTGWFLLPFAWSLTDFRQGGIRYVYAAFLPFSLVCGATLARGVAWLRARWSGKPWLAMVATGVVAYLGAACASVHPYYLDYYNEIIGGPRGAYFGRKLAVGWWGEGIDRAVAYMNEHAQRNATYEFKGPIDHTFVGLRDDLVAVTENPEYLIQTHREPGKEVPDGYREEMTVRIQGAPLVGIYQRKM